METISQARGRSYRGMLAALLIVGAGCATSNPRVAQFEPVPVAQIGAEELEPVQLRPMSELLEAAQSELRLANKAQADGDREAAMRHYTAMLELLIEADLDPSMFYNLRPEFDRILTASRKQAEAFARHHPPGIPSGQVDTLNLVGGLEIPYPVPERVLLEVEEIQKLYPEGFQRGLDRSGKYRPYIEAELEKAGLPRDLVWLAMVESQFTPKIVSRAGAGGMWQFMKSTAQRYGLRVDYYVDERYDWRKSTRAAIAYLKDLHALFNGEWPLAVSAYNMGERGLERAIASNGGQDDLWRLIETPPAANRIRRETKKFYAKLLASVIVTRMPERYGFVLNPEPEERVAYAKVDDAYDLAELNRAAGLPKGTLQRLNPHLVRGVTPPDEEFQLAVPHESERVMLAALDKVSPVRLAASGTHVVARGETLSEIAARYGVQLRELMVMNNIRRPERLRAGQKLLIGVQGAGGRVAVDADGRRVYTVRSGDSLSRIASRERVTVRNLQQWNGMGQSARIHPGQRLYISAPGTTRLATDNFITHTVRRGENASLVAQRYGVSTGDLLTWNGLTKRSVLQVGQKLRVYGVRSGAMTEVAEASDQKVVHKVARGENASVIAARYNVSTSEFLKWNELSERSVLRAGDEYVVYLKSGDRIIHTVRRGENPTTIARRYGVSVSELRQWNNWSRSPVLHIGEKVVIHPQT